MGVGLPTGIPGAESRLLIDWAVRAEARSFSHLAAFDRVRYGNYEPLTALTAAAAVTSQIRLATTILIAPLRNTALLAKQAASLDRLSGGRLVLGVGIGPREDDYEGAEVSYQARGKRLGEQLADLRRHWEEAEIGPPPARPGGPEVLVGGNSGPAFARVARSADGYIHGGGPPRAFERAARAARAAWIDAERPGRPRLWGQGYFALGDAAEAGASYLRHYYAFAGPFAERVVGAMLTTPEAVAEYLRGYEEAGCDEMCLLPAVPDLEQLDRLAEIICP